MTMEDQQISHEEILVSLEEHKSIYSILANYINNAEKNGLYVKGYVDGDDTYQAFLREFNSVCKTKFIIRTSWRKEASNVPRRSRYGKEDRIYWEYHSGNLEVPFSGTPFVVKSCLTMHCQYGSHYYKTTAERVTKQYRDHQSDPSIPLPEVKKRRNKPSKKRDCPAIMHVREVVMYPDFSVDLDRMFDTKFHLRQEKSQILLKLKDAMNLNKTQGTPLKCIRRFYINMPLPEVHIGHPQPCGGIGPTIHPSVTEKIDSLLSLGIYDARHVRIIVHDFVKEILLKQDNGQVYQYNVVLYPSELEIADYIYMSSITTKPTIIVEKDDYQSQPGIKGEMEGSIHELIGLIENCHQEALIEAKDSMKKIINTVKRQGQPVSTAPPAKRKKMTSRKPATDHREETFDVNENENNEALVINLDDENEALTEIIIFQGKGNPEQTHAIEPKTTIPLSIDPNLLQSNHMTDPSKLPFSEDPHTSQLPIDLNSPTNQLDVIYLEGNS